MVRETSRNSVGFSPDSVVEMTRLNQRGRDRGDLGLHLLFGLAPLAPLQASRRLGQLAAGLGHGLLKSLNLPVMESLRVGDDHSAVISHHVGASLEGGEPEEAFVIPGARRSC